MRTGIYFIVVVLLAATTWRVYWTRQQFDSRAVGPEALKQYQAALDTIPLELREGHYRGQPFPETEQVVAYSGADFYASNVYSDPSGGTYRLWVGGAVRLRGYFHRPSNCMPARGWEVVEDQSVDFVAFPTRNAEPKMRRVMLQFGTRKMLVYYWFQCENQVADDDGATNYFQFLDLLASRPFRPLYIVSVYVPIVGDIAHAELRARAFLDAIGPHLRDSILRGGRQA